MINKVKFEEAIGMTLTHDITMVVTGSFKWLPKMHITDMHTRKISL